MFKSPPNLADYTTFLYSVVGIPATQLPPNSDIILTTFNIAQCTVNCELQCLGSLYALAVYNLGADRLINFAPDQPNQTYFTDLRGPKGLNLNSVSVGVPSAASDNGTAIGILNPEWMQTMTIADLQTLRTPYGRRYMEIAQAYGPNIWGVS